jgi:hypothetical protein
MPDVAVTSVNRSGGGADSSASGVGDVVLGVAAVLLADSALSAGSHPMLNTSSAKSTTVQRRL